MRGKGSGFLRGSVKTGITPAYAGKRPDSHPWWKTEWDHPRLCGEKSAIYFLISVRLGSPPPMRGKDGESWVYGNAQGITPAYAGKSDLGESCSRLRQDHPYAGFYP